MSNLDPNPPEFACAPVEEESDRLTVTVLEPRAVPLGGPRAMTVRRTLPQRERSLIGAWCFADHYGPDDVSVTGGMDVPPHPHIGLQTASWLFAGEIEHRDTNGIYATVRPGELNLMTAGHGIAHTEVSTPETTVLHGVQLWIALPSGASDGPSDFAHYVPPIVRRGPVAARVFLGELLGSASPVTTASPLLGAELAVEPGAGATLELRADFEHGILVDSGELRIDDAATPTVVGRAEMAYLGLGATSVRITNTADEPARLLIIGGEPLGEDIVMWWNFVARDHAQIAAARDEWMAASTRFGQVEGYVGAVQHLPAPPLPHSTLRARVNTPGRART